MKKFFALLIVIYVFPFTILAKEESNQDLLGIISKSDLQKEPYSLWFNENYNGYEIDQNILSRIEKLLDGITIKIVMGTWCHDSKREVPRFYKILSNLGDAGVNVEMIAVDRDKRVQSGEIDSLAITNTPTFIFFRDEREMNRIVETPVKSLEDDMHKILNDEYYRHSKM